MQISDEDDFQKFVEDYKNKVALSLKKDTKRGSTDLDCPPLIQSLVQLMLRIIRHFSSQSIPGSNSPKIRIPTLTQFLHDSDNVHGEGTYSQFEKAFAEEKDLSDRNFQELGVNKIGWKITLKQASAQYS
ncbi:3692_t:CDS:2 [Paraglomus occultum]|uniref:3692_t:CDS:1 n=1 Tax=Paraglomus occultum TaxID=144539 RepID=A0A9N9A968_9GLOM|nr:3692_t:CDS:2 [Paraglomus occultum]